MLTSYEVSYRLNGDNGLSKIAVVVVNDVGIVTGAIINVLARYHHVAVSAIIDVYPVRLTEGSMIVVRV